MTWGAFSSTKPKLKCHAIQPEDMISAGSVAAAVEFRPALYLVLLFPPDGPTSFL